MSLGARARCVVKGKGEGEEASERGDVAESLGLAGLARWPSRQPTTSTGASKPTDIARASPRAIATTAASQHGRRTASAHAPLHAETITAQQLLGDRRIRLGTCRPVEWRV